MAEPLLRRWLVLGAAGSAAALLSCGKEEPPVSDIVINEVVPVNAEFAADETHLPEDPDIEPPEAPEYDDCLELYNRGTETVDISGYFIRVRGYKGSYQLGAGLTLQPGEVVNLWADNAGAGTGVHLPFRLGNDGDWLELSDELGRRADFVEYGYSATPRSWARIPDGGDWQWCAYPSPGVPNGARCQLELSDTPPEAGNGGSTGGSGTGGTGTGGSAGGAGGADSGMAGNGPASGAGGA